MRKKGQTTTVEYVVLVLLVIAGLVVMTIYTRRALQGRIRDGNNLAVIRATALINSPVAIEYEPYYQDTTSDLDKTSVKEEKILPVGGLFINSATGVAAQTTSRQIEPRNE